MMRLAPVLFLVIALCPVTPLAAQAKIDVAETSWKFGKIDQGVKLTHEITVTNKGQSTLTIKKIGVSCGCVAGTMKTMALEPGVSEKLVITLDSSHVFGDIKKEVFVDSDDKALPHVSIFVEGRIEAVWELSTSNINLGDVPVGTEGKAEFRLSVLREKNVNIKDVRVSSPRIIVEKTAFELPDKTHGYNCVVKLAKDTPIGSFYGSIEVITDFAAMNTRTINVQARVIGKVTVNPDRIVFGQVKVGQTRSITVRVAKRDGAGLAIDRATSTDPTITSKIVEKTAGKEYDIEFTYTPGKTRFNNGRISIFTNEPDQQIIFVTFTGSAEP